MNLKQKHDKIVELNVELDSLQRKYLESGLADSYLKTMINVKEQELDLLIRPDMYEDETFNQEGK